MDCLRNNTGIQEKQQETPRVKEGKEGLCAQGRWKPGAACGPKKGLSGRTPPPTAPRPAHPTLRAPHSCHGHLQYELQERFSIPSDLHTGIGSHLEIMHRHCSSPIGF